MTKLRTERCHLPARLYALCVLVVFQSACGSSVGPDASQDPDRDIGVSYFDVRVADGTAHLFWSTGPDENVDDGLPSAPIREVSSVQILLSKDDLNGPFEVAGFRSHAGRDSLLLDGLTNGTLHYFRIETSYRGDRIGQSTPRVVMPGPVADSRVVLSSLEPQSIESFAWSPAGDRFAYVRTAWTPYSENPEDREYFPANVFLIDVESGVSQQLTQYGLEDGASRPNYALFHVAWSADGSRLAYVYSPTRTNHSLDYRIWTISTEDATPAVATAGPLDSDPAWLQSGEIVFARKTEAGPRGYSEIFAADPQQPVAARRVAGDTDLRGKEDLSVNPVNDRVVFAGSPRFGNASDSRLYALNASTGSVQALMPSSMWEDSEPSWLSDGRTVVFTSDRSGHDEIWALDTATGETRQVTRGLSWARRNGASVSADRASIAFFERNERDSRGSVVVAPF